MSVDLIENHSPAPAPGVDRPIEHVRVGNASSPLAAGPLPRVVVADGPTGTVETLLLSVAHGDREAFVALQSRMAGLVHVNVRRVLRDASRAEAVTQSIFAELLEDTVGFDPRRDSAQTWLLTRAHQRAMDGLRSVDDTDDPPSAGSTRSRSILLV
jgi:hypothetical protein